jgi:sugar phosphate isomerase/epimerase
MQIEIFHFDQLNEWTDENCGRMKEAVEKSGMKISQFVAHFLLDSFVSPERLSSDSGLAEIGKVSSFLSRFRLADLVTVPLGVFQGTFSAPVYRNFIRKLNAMQRLLELEGLRMAVEPLPGSLGADLAFLDELPGIGLNLDPGHLLCSGIDPFDLSPAVLERVYATHLCDNDGSTNSSDAPGTHRSREEWSALLKGLGAAGYGNSLDLEIICPAEGIESEYERGKFFLESFEYNIIHSK